MKKLFDQMWKFALVGGFSFLVDAGIAYVILKVLMLIIGESIFTVGSMIGSAIGFTVSVIVNYILSFKFVFERKDDLDRKAQFVIFVVLSLIGLGLNQLLIFFGAQFYEGNETLKAVLNYDLAFWGNKIFATVVVMIYNFISRKIFLEKK